MKRNNSTKKSTSRNEQFGASGGAVSSDTEQVTSFFALVRTSPMPPPDAKLPGVRCKQTTAWLTISRKPES